jgi:hypothetical protein
MPQCLQNNNKHGKNSWLQVASAIPAYLSKASRSIKQCASIIHTVHVHECKTHHHHHHHHQITKLSHSINAIECKTHVTCSSFGTGPQTNQPPNHPLYTVLRTVATQGSNERNKRLSKLRLAFKSLSITCTAHKRRCVGAQGTKHASSPCKQTMTTRHSRLLHLSKPAQVETPAASDKSSNIKMQSYCSYIMPIHMPTTPPERSHAKELHSTAEARAPFAMPPYDYPNNAHTRAAWWLQQLATCARHPQCSPPQQDQCSRHTLSLLLQMDI